MFRSGHVSETQLVECYMAGRTHEAADPRVTDHLTTCRACRGQFDALAAFLDEDRDAAIAEADEAFPADRLQAQHQQIMKRLDHVHRSARVISFPGRDVSVPERPAAMSRLAPRWLAAAAAAGLFIGVAVGGYLGPDRFVSRRTVRVAEATASRPRAVAAPAPTAAPAVLVGTSADSVTQDDDAFLMELELALANPRSRELRPFDALTPHVR